MAFELDVHFKNVITNLARVALRGLYSRGARDERPAPRIHGQACSPGIADECVLARCVTPALAAACAYKHAAPDDGAFSVSGGGGGKGVAFTSDWRTSKETKAPGGERKKCGSITRALANRAELRFDRARVMSCRIDDGDGGGGTDERLLLGARRYPRRAGSKSLPN